MEKQPVRKFYRVITDMYHFRCPDPQEHGFETERAFRHALHKLVDRWRNRVGECIGRKYDHLLLRFHDTPGSKPDEALLPEYLLETVEDYEMEEAEERDETEAEVDKAFGFD